VELQDVAKAREELATELVQMGLEFAKRNYLNIGSDHSPALRETYRTVLRLRDSIQHRATSVMWHVAVLYDGREGVRRRFEQDNVASFEATDADPMPLIHYMRRQSFLFDDLLFNTVSLFDYIGHLIGVTRFAGKKHVWSQVAAQCRKTPCRVPERLASVVVEANERWIRALDQFRDDLIHYEDPARSGQESFDFETTTMTWTVWMPDDLRVRLAALGMTAERIEVEDAGLTIARAAFDTGIAVIRALWETYPMGVPPWMKKPSGGVP
jgi:hypothetical protein